MQLERITGLVKAGLDDPLNTGALCSRILIDDPSDISQRQVIHEARQCRLNPILGKKLDVAQLLLHSSNIIRGIRPRGREEVPAKTHRRRAALHLPTQDGPRGLGRSGRRGRGAGVKDADGFEGRKRGGVELEGLVGDGGAGRHVVAAAPRLEVGLQGGGGGEELAVVVVHLVIGDARVEACAGNTRQA